MSKLKGQLFSGGTTNIIQFLPVASLMASCATLNVSTSKLRC